MQPVRWMSPFTHPAQTLDGLPVSPVDGRYDPAPHAGIASPLEHGVTVSIERVVVQVGMSVDQVRHVGNE